eukprot:scaffold1308_cov246-Chaetoceros_neogracile.AAC.14
MSSDDKKDIFLEAIASLPCYATATAPSKSDDDQKKRTGIIRGVNAQNPTVQSMRNFASGSGKRKIDVVLQQPPQASFSEILKKAGRSGIGGGIPGFIAGIVQVLTLMWLRTVMNYQCRYGASFPQAMRILYSEGGIPRFYRGMSFALVQAPLARFVATAANDGVETLLANLKLTENWGPGRSTIIASIIVGLWRMVDSVEGFRNLMRKVKAGKIYVLYQGAFANAASAIAAHYPWFYIYRVLSRSKLLHSMIGSHLLRNATVGFAASVVSDTFANAIRVVKTTKQSIASKHTVSYGEVVAMILAADGWKGLFGRGLRTRILGNAVQSILFTIIWRGLADKWSNKAPEPRLLNSLGPKSDDIDEVLSEVEIDDVPMEEERN